MGAADVIVFLGGQLLVALPSLIGWTAAVIVAILLLLRGGGKAATLLLIGAAVMLGAAVLHVPLAGVAPLLMSNGWRVTDAAKALSVLGIAIQLVQLGGIICLVCAFWLQFNVREILAK